MSGQPEWSNLTTRLSSYYRSLTWLFLGRRPCRDAPAGQAGGPPGPRETRGGALRCALPNHRVQPLSQGRAERVPAKSRKRISMDESSRAWALTSTPTNAVAPKMIIFVRFRARSQPGARQPSKRLLALCRHGQRCGRVRRRLKCPGSRNEACRALPGG